MRDWKVRLAEVLEKILPEHVDEETKAMVLHAYCQGWYDCSNDIKEDLATLKGEMIKYKH